MEVFGVAYTRVSTLGQLLDKDGRKKEDSSLDSQKFRIEEFLNSKSSVERTYKVLEYLSDEGISGKNIDARPGMKKLIHLVKSKKVNFIISTDLARLSRTTADFLSLVDLCKKYDVEIFLIKENIDPTTPHGQMFATMWAMLAQFERETTSERLRSNAKARLRSKGRINGSSEILGLDKLKDSKEIYQINPAEVEQLHRVLKVYLESEGKGAALKMTM